MKTVFNFFSRPEKAGAGLPSYEFREPRFAPRQAPVRPAVPARLESGVSVAAATTTSFSPPQSASPDTAGVRDNAPPATGAPAVTPTPILPDAYVECLANLRQVVAARKSPFNALVAAADRLKEFIPNETARLQAALAIQGDQWPREALSLAISSHIADIEHARLKTRGQVGIQSRERQQQLTLRVADLERQNRLIEEQVATLRQTMERNRAAIQSARAELDTGVPESATDAFLDQAARNLTQDLLAKKVILDLP